VRAGLAAALCSVLFCLGFASSSSSLTLPICMPALRSGGPATPATSLATPAGSSSSCGGSSGLSTNLWRRLCCIAARCIWPP
jgi:Na+/H+-dicarboxylate symporter